MTEENKIVEVKKECLCQSKWFKEFITKTLAVFVGAFCALSLFAALHKPPMPPCPFGHGPMMRPGMHCHHHFYKHAKCGHHKKFEKRDFKKLENKDFQRVRTNNSEEKR